MNEQFSKPDFQLFENNGLSYIELGATKKLRDFNKKYIEKVVVLKKSGRVSKWRNS